MKYLCIIDNIGSGGSERQILNLAKHFQDTGHETKMLIYTEDNFHSDEVKKNDIITVSAGHQSVLKMILNTIKIVRQNKPDYIVAFLPPQIITSQLACFFYKPKKLIISMRCANEDAFTSHRMRLISKMFHKVDSIVCNSEKEVDLWKKYFPNMLPKVHVIYNSVHINERIYSIKRKNYNTINLIVAATYYPVKNVDGLIEAMKLLPSEALMHLHVDWYGKKDFTNGDTKTYDQAVEKISKYCLSSSIILHDRTIDIHQRMADADVVGLFSKFEGMPNAICEGMMLGKPIIMTKVSDYETLAGKGNGIICKSDQPLDIAQALLELLHLTTEQRLEMGKVSMSIAQVLFSEKEVYSKWDNILLNP